MSGYVINAVFKHDCTISLNITIIEILIVCGVATNFYNYSCNYKIVPVFFIFPVRLQYFEHFLKVYT